MTSPASALAGLLILAALASKGRPTVPKPTLSSPKCDPHVIEIPWRARAFPLVLCRVLVFARVSSFATVFDQQRHICGHFLSLPSLSASGLAQNRPSAALPRT